MLQRSAGDGLPCGLERAQGDRQADPNGHRLILAGLRTKSHHQRGGGDAEELKEEGGYHDPPSARAEEMMAAAEEIAAKSKAGDGDTGTDPAVVFSGGYET